MPLHLPFSRLSSALLPQQDELLRLDEELMLARRKVAELLLRRFELDPQKRATEGIEAVLHLLRGGDREQAIDLLLHIGWRLNDSSAAKAVSALSILRGADDGDSAQLVSDILRHVDRDELLPAQALLDTLEHETAAARFRNGSARLCRGIVLFAAGEMPLARAALDESLAILLPKQEYAACAIASLHLAQTLLAIGDLDGAAAAARRTLELEKSAPTPRIALQAELLLAEILLARFQPAAAREYVLRILERQELEPAPRLHAAAYFILARSCALHLDGKGVLFALEQASLFVWECPADAHLADIEFADLTLFAMAPEARRGSQIFERAERAWRYFSDCGRRYLQTRAALSMAAALLTSASKEDSDRADELLLEAQDLSTRHAYGLLHLRATLLESALWRRRGDSRRSKTLLFQGIASASAQEDTLALQLLRAAEKSSDDGSVLPGVAAILLQLGLRSEKCFELVDRSGRRDADEADRQRALGAHDLIVELDRGIIARGGGGTSISGRPLMAALLAAFLASLEEGVSAERLFHEVWGGKEYNPLRHRNTIYVAIARLRQALRDLLPGREVVETLPTGWRLSRDVDLCLIRTKRAH